MLDSSDPPPVAVVGAGAVGSTLAHGLTTCGYRVQAVLSREQEDAQVLADRVGASVAGTPGDGLPTEVRLVLVCVPDEAIPTVADALAALDHPWPDTIVAHTSGARAAGALRPLAQRGAASMSFHPLQTFTSDTPPAALEGVVVGIEGADRAVTAGETIAQALGAHPVRLTAEEKTRYHCAAALASNGLVALLAVVEEVFGSVQGTSDPDVSTEALIGPLVEQTWTHLQQGSPEGVLTGPVMRGDEATVEAHLDALSETAPHLVPFYVALSTEMVRIAVRGGHLDPGQAESLLGTLRAAADASADGEGPSSPSF